MSFQVLAIVERIHFKNVSRKAVAKQLANSANEVGGSIYPSIEYVAKYTDCHERTVQRCIKGLLQSKILNLVREGGKGRRSTNEYAYNMPLLKALDDGVCEIYSYKNEKKQSCLGVRTVGEHALCNDNQLVSCKGDTVSPLKFAKGDNASCKGDNASRKGDTVSPNPFKEPFNEEEGEAQAQQRGQQEPKREPQKTTASPLLKSLFEEYNVTAKRAGFTPVSENLFDDVVDQLNCVIEKIGVEKWRECLGIAAGDDLCCGRVKPSANYGTPWVLNFKRMCDAVWVDSKLDEWRRAGKQPKTHDPNSMMITPQSPSWNAWLERYTAASKRFLIKQMNAGNTIAVPTEWPDSAAAKHAGGGI